VSDDSLVFDRRTESDLASNQKVVIENHIECDYCPTAHADFNRAVYVSPDRPGPPNLSIGPERLIAHIQSPVRDTR
jgi:phenylpropionate dioxygenase-like ring-hydroxylating dioxygenase large terminal subunit